MQEAKARQGDLGMGWGAAEGWQGEATAVPRIVHTFIL